MLSPFGSHNSIYDLLALQIFSKLKQQQKRNKIITNRSQQLQEKMLQF